MKIVPKTIILVILIFLSCRQSSDKKEMPTVKKTTTTNFEKAEKRRIENRKLVEEQNLKDSLDLVKILNNALKIGNLNKDNNSFKKVYAESMSDSSYQVKVDISSGYYFTKQSPHWIIRRNAPNAIYIDIFSKSKNELKKVLSHEQWAMTYVNDSIQDINGDNIKDFVVNWYGATGCCLMAFSNVYLLRTDKKTFSNENEFINPTFSPKEKIVRGICYGHPGETEMYKFKWNGETVDTLEYVSYEKNKAEGKTGRVIISNYQPYHKNFKILRTVKQVPKEYKKINEYSWFTGIGI